MTGSNPRRGFAARGIRLNLAPSPLHLVLIVLAAGLALVVTWMLAFDVLLASALSLALVLVAFEQIRAARAFNGLSLPDDPDDPNNKAAVWRLETVGGERLPAVLVREVYAGRWFLVMHFSTRQGRRSLVIGRDTQNRADFRRMRVLLLSYGPRLLAAGGDLSRKGVA